MKQTIVIRKDLNMRKGKMIAQGSHAVLAGVKQIENGNNERHKEDLEEWYRTSFRKITLSVDSEEELIELYNKIKAAGLNTYLIEDNGKTEFKGVKTKTCISIGPHTDKEIDKFTNNLKLL